MGANEQGAVQAQNQQQVIADAVRTASGATQSARLLSAAEKLEKSGNPQAAIKAMQLREQAAALAVQEEQLTLQRQQTEYQGDRISVAKTEAENRATQLRIQEEQNKALATQRAKTNQINNTSVTLVYDAEGNAFQVRTYKTGDKPDEYIPMSGSPAQPVGRTIDAVTHRQLQGDTLKTNALYREKFIENRDNAKEQFNTVQSNYRTAADAYALLQAIKKAGGTTGGIPNALEQKARKMTNLMDKEGVTKEILAKELGIYVASQLKTIFGGSNITEGEREFLLINQPTGNDSTEVLDSMLAKSMEVAKKGMTKWKTLLQTKDYVEWNKVESDLMNQTYEKMTDEMIKLNPNIGNPSVVDPTNPTADMLLAKKKQAERKAQLQQEERKSRRGSGARAGTSF
jgi:hypothetical protein